MAGRRRDTRYRLSKPLQGWFECFQDVAIERQDGSELSAVSDTPLRCGDRLRLDFVGTELRATVHVRVAEIAPTIVDGTVRYRLRLGIVG